MILLGARAVYVLAGFSELVPDEAYYWDWSRRPAWCYYSKPPMVAWIMGTSTALLGDTTWAVRLPAALLSTLSLAGTAVLARALFDHRTAFWTVALVAASPGASALGLVMTIDPPLVCAWSWALVLMWRSLQGGPVRTWLATGLVVAAGLMSKQSMLVFPAAATIALCVVPRWRPHWSTPGPWLLLAASALPAIPILAWNRAHGWVMFAHSASHIQAGSPSLSVGTFLEFLGAQIGLVSPWTWFVMAAAALQALRSWRHVDERVHFLWLFGVLPLAGIHLMAFAQRVNANWSAPFYPTVHVLAAAWLLGHVLPSDDAARRARHLRPALRLGAGLALIAYALPILFPLLPLGGSRRDPTARIREWSAFAAEVDAALKKAPSPETTIVASSRRQLAAELAFYMPGNPRTYRTPDWSVSSQYEVWGGPERTGIDALIVEDPGKPIAEHVRQSFASLEPFGEVEVPLGPGGARRASLYLARDLQRWVTPYGED